MIEPGKNKFKLEELKKEQIFKAPKGYFNDLPQVIQARVLEENSKRQPIQIILPKMALRYALPALLLLLAVTFVLMNDSSKDLEPSALIAQVDDETILYYLENEIDLTTNEILESVPDLYLEDEFGNITDGMEEINIDNEMLEKYGIEQELTF